MSIKLVFNQELAMLGYADGMVDGEVIDVAPFESHFNFTVNLPFAIGEYWCDTFQVSFDNDQVSVYYGFEVSKEDAIEGGSGQAPEGTTPDQWVEGAHIMCPVYQGDRGWLYEEAKTIIVTGSIPTSNLDWIIYNISEREEVEDPEPEEPEEPDTQKPISGIWYVPALRTFEVPEVNFEEEVLYSVSFVGTRSLEPAIFHGTSIEFFPGGYKLHYSHVDSMYSYPSPGFLNAGDYEPYGYVMDFGKTSQLVSSQFYDLFTSIAWQDNYDIIPAGVYRIKDTITDFPFPGTWVCPIKYTCYGYSTGNGNLYKAYSSGYLVDNTGFLGGDGTGLAVIEYMCEPEYPEKGPMFVITHLDNEYWDGWVYDDPSVITVSENVVVTSSFQTWFLANAELQETQPAVTITYRGSTIAVLSGGQVATLKCAGMKMGSNVVVSVANGISGGGGSGGGADISDATAEAEHVLKGYTAYGADGKITGTVETYTGSIISGGSQRPDDAVPVYTVEVEVK